jgi:leader peptidase (prepilin peptidase)/N-methyltransferase
MSEGLLMGLLQLFTGLVGLVIGSFLNVCIARLPEDRSIITPRSHCQSCGHTLGVRELIPVVSWLALRGRCSHCASPISPAYPLVEILTAMLAWLLFRRLVPELSALDAAHVVAWVAYFTFLCLLVVAAYVDVRHWIIPDWASIYAVPLGVIVAIVLPLVGYDGWLSLDWRQSVFGALVGGSALATASILARWVLGREALGWGDVKLMAMIGAFVGPVQVIFLVLLPASLIGSLISVAHLLWTRRRGYLPYGPSLALAGVIYVFYGDIIARRWLPGVALWMGLL